MSSRPAADPRAASSPYVIGDPGRAARELSAGAPCPGAPADVELSAAAIPGVLIRAATVRRLQHRGCGTPRQDAFAIGHRADGGAAEDHREPGLDLPAVPEPDVLSPSQGPVAGVSGPPAPAPAQAPARAVNSAAAPTLPLRHRNPLPRRRSGRTHAPPAVPAAAGTQMPSPMGLAYLILSTDSAGDRAGWRRGRSVLREVDAKLATIPGIASMVRILQTSGDLATSKLRPAGRPSWRDVRRPPEGTDLARVLGAVQLAAKRDLTTLQLSTAEVARPAIVLFAADAPLADAITAQAYGELVSQVSITWVVPERSADLMSPAFADASGTRVILDHQSVADEIVAILVRGMRHAPTELREV